MISSACMDGTLKNKVDGNDTTKLSHHPYTLCHSSCQLCTPQNSLHARSTLNEQGTQHCSPHSLLSNMLSTNKILQHNLNYNISYGPYTTHTIHAIHTIQTQHCSWTPHFLHTGKAEHIYLA